MKRLFVLMLLAASLTGFAAASPLDRKAAAPLVSAVADQEFVITLEENPTTGYQWEFTVAGNAGSLKIVKNAFVPPESDLCGAPGVRKLTVRTGTPGTAQIIARYRRSWEPEDATAETLVFTFRAR